MEPRVTTKPGLPGAQKSRTPKTLKMALVCLFALVVVVGAAAVWQVAFHKAPPPLEKVDSRKVVFAPPDKTSLAVLPFQNMTGDPQQEYFSDGMAEQLITGLSQTPDIYVAARTSSFAFKGKPMTAQQISEQLGVRYLLEGSVQRDADRVRINIQLIDGRDGSHIWAKRYDHLLEDIFKLQDQITMEVMEALNVKFIPGITETNLSISLKHCRPADLKLTSLFQGSQPILPQPSRMSLLPASCSRRPSPSTPISRRHTRVQWGSLTWTIWYRLTSTPEKSIELAEKAAQRCIALSPDLPPPHGWLSMISVVKRDMENAVLHAEKAVELSPNDPGCYFSLGMALTYSGRFEEAVRPTNFLRLSPLRPLTWINMLASACCGNKQYDKAIQLWTESIERSPDYFFAYQGLAVAYELSGNHEKARWAAENIMRVTRAFPSRLLEKMALNRDEEHGERSFWRTSQCGDK